MSALRRSQIAAQLVELVAACDTGFESEDEAVWDVAMTRALPLAERLVRALKAETRVRHDWGRAAQWYAEGESLAEIARRLGCSYKQVSNARRHYGWPLRRPDIAARQAAYFAGLRAAEPPSLGGRRAA